MTRLEVMTGMSVDVRFFPFRDPHPDAEYLKFPWERERRKWWKDTYKGLVPNKWINNSDGILRDFKADLGASWSAVKIEAALNHDEDTAFVMASHMKLRPEHLALVLSYPWTDTRVSRKVSNQDLIIERQKNRGTTDEEIEKAKRLEQEFKAKKQIFYSIS